MADFNIRTDAVDVEQIMRQIRARIQAKRGVDYTEEQIQELANVKLERFLDPKGVRSDLVEQFKRARDRTVDPFSVEQYRVDANDLYGSSRSLVRIVRKLLNPIFKLFLNTNRLIQVLHQQTDINAAYEKQFHLLRAKSQQRDEVDVLYYELVHNLVLELTRVGIENRNLKMRIESLSSRMDFDERRARALEGVVQYRPGTGPSREPVQTRHRADDRAPQQPAGPVAVTPQAGQAAGAGETSDQGDETARRRRRRRRGRRGGRGRAGEPIAADGTTPAEIPSAEESATPPHGDPTGDAALPDGGGTADRDAAFDSAEDAGPDPSAQ